MTASASGFIIFTRREGGTLEVWRSTHDEYMEIVETGRMTDPFTRASFQPAYIAFLVLCFDHDFVLGGPRDARGA